jgi:hypothetical protein
MPMATRRSRRSGASGPALGPVKQPVADLVEVIPRQRQVAVIVAEVRVHSRDVAGQPLAMRDRHEAVVAAVPQLYRDANRLERESPWLEVRPLVAPPTIAARRETLDTSRFCGMREPGRAAAHPESKRDSVPVTADQVLAASIRSDLDRGGPRICRRRVCAGGNEPVRPGLEQACSVSRADAGDVVIPCGRQWVDCSLPRTAMSNGPSSACAFI